VARLVAHVKMNAAVLGTLAPTTREGAPSPDVHVKMDATVLEILAIM